MLRDKIAWSDFGHAKRARRANNRMLFVKWLAALRFISAAQHPVIQLSTPLLTRTEQDSTVAPVLRAASMRVSVSNRSREAQADEAARTTS